MVDIGPTLRTQFPKNRPEDHPVGKIEKDDPFFQDAEKVLEREFIYPIKLGKDFKGAKVADRYAADFKVRTKDGKELIYTIYGGTISSTEEMAKAIATTRAYVATLTAKEAATRAHGMKLMLKIDPGSSGGNVGLLIWDPADKTFLALAAKSQFNNTPAGLHEMGKSESFRWWVFPISEADPTENSWLKMQAYHAFIEKTGGQVGMMSKLMPYLNKSKWTSIATGETEVERTSAVAEKLLKGDHAEKDGPLHQAVLRSWRAEGDRAARAYVPLDFDLMGASDRAIEGDVIESTKTRHAKKEMVRHLEVRQNQDKTDKAKIKELRKEIQKLGNRTTLLSTELAFRRWDRLGIVDQPEPDSKEARLVALRNEIDLVQDQKDALQLLGDEVDNPARYAKLNKIIQARVLIGQLALDANDFDEVKPRLVERARLLREAQGNLDRRWEPNGTFGALDFSIKQEWRDRLREGTFGEGDLATTLGCAPDQLAGTKPPALGRLVGETRAQAERLIDEIALLQQQPASPALIVKQRQLDIILGALDGTPPEVTAARKMVVNHVADDMEGANNDLLMRWDLQLARLSDLAQAGKDVSAYIPNALPDLSNRDAFEAALVRITDEIDKLDG